MPFSPRGRCYRARPPMHLFLPPSLLLFHREPWWHTNFRLSVKKNRAKSTFLSCLPVACILLQQQETGQWKRILPSPDPGLGSASIGAFPDDIILSPDPGTCLQGHQHREQKHTCSPLALLECDRHTGHQVQCCLHLGILSKDWTELKLLSREWTVNPSWAGWVFFVWVTWYHQRVLSFSLWPGSKREDFFFRA